LSSLTVFGLSPRPAALSAARSWADCIASVSDQGEDVVVRVGVIESSRRAGAKASARSVGPPSSRRRWAASSRRSLSLGLIWPSAPRSCRASTRAARLASVRRRSRTAPVGARGRRPARALTSVMFLFPHVRGRLPSVCDGVPAVGHLVATVCDEVAFRARPAAVIVGQVA
jgi:hypothetical protein